MISECPRLQEIGVHFWKMLWGWTPSGRDYPSHTLPIGGFAGCIPSLLTTYKFLNLVKILFERISRFTFPRKIAFENTTKMISECSRLQELGVSFRKNSWGWPPLPKCKGMTIPYLVKFHENYQKRMTDCRKYGSAFVEISWG